MLRVNTFVPQWSSTSLGVWLAVTFARGLDMVNAVSDSLAALYQSLKQFNADVRKDRRLAVPPADSVTVHSAQCGSRLTLDARIEGNRIREIGYRVRACALGQATTAIVARRAPGLDAAALRRVGAQLQAILAGCATQCEWPEMEMFTLIKSVPSRHGSAMLPFHALEQLFDRASVLQPDGLRLSVPRRDIEGARNS